jgi:plastin-1
MLDVAIAGYILTYVVLISLQLVSKLREGKNKGAFDVSKNRITVQGSSASVSHTINEDERREFTRHMNSVLAQDKDIGDRLPLPLDTMQIFDECKDGLVLSKLINDSVPDVGLGVLLIIGN